MVDVFVVVGVVAVVFVFVVVGVVAVVFVVVDVFFCLEDRRDSNIFPQQHQSPIASQSFRK